MFCLWTSVAILMIRISAEIPPNNTDAFIPFHHQDMHTGSYSQRSKRNATNDKRRQGGTLPTIFVSGVQKGGSSSLYELMVQHPQLCGGMHKENHFFDHPDNYALGTEYFRDMYQNVKCDKVAGTHFIDGTPILHYPSVWQRIYDTYSEKPELRDSLKFIVLLREPVSRDYSWYEHTTRTDIHLGESFAQIRTMNETYINSTYFKKGHYVEQLAAFTKVFRRDQILIFSSAGAFQSTANVMESIRQFIGVREHDSFYKSLPHDDHLIRMGKEGIADCVTAHVPALDCWIRDTMGEHFELYNLMLYSWLRETRAKANPNEPSFSPLFSNPGLIPCVKDARRKFDQIRAVDANMLPPKLCCALKVP